MISKKVAHGIQHLLSTLLPEHRDSRTLTSPGALEAIAELADLSVQTLGHGLNGAQAVAEWEHYQPIVISRAQHREYQALLAGRDPKGSARTPGQPNATPAPRDPQSP